MQDLGKFPAHALSRLERVAERTLVTGELDTLLDRAPLFSGFTHEDMLTLADYMGVYRAGSGETIIIEGEVGDYMLIVIRGEVDILKRGIMHEQQHMATVGAGTTIGEMSMIDGEPRFASCRTNQATTFAVLTREAMNKMLAQAPKLATRIMEKLVSMLSVRLRQTSGRLLRYMEGGVG